jgi:hypothetical protein
MELNMNKKVLTLTAAFLIGAYVDLAHAQEARQFQRFGPEREYTSTTCSGYRYKVTGSKNFYNFQSDLRKDKAERLMISSLTIISNPFKS